MRTNLRVLLPRLGLGLGLTWLGACSVSGDDRFTTLDLRQVQVGGEIGRRIDVTIRNKKQVEWTLTEFSDPGGRAAYFRLRDARAAVDDELFNRVSSPPSLPRP